MKTVKSKNGDKVLLSNKNEWCPCTKISQFITILSGNQQYTILCNMSFQEMFHLKLKSIQMYSFNSTYNLGLTRVHVPKQKTDGNLGSLFVKAIL